MWRLASTCFFLILSFNTWAEDFHWTFPDGSGNYSSPDAACSAYAPTLTPPPNHTYSYTGFVFNGEQAAICQCDLEDQFGNVSPNATCGNVFRQGDACPANHTYDPVTGACEADIPDCPSGQVWDGAACVKDCESELSGSHDNGLGQCVCGAGAITVRQGVTGGSACQEPEGECDIQGSDVAFIDGGQAYCNSQFCDSGQKAAYGAVGANASITCIADIQQEPDQDGDGIPDSQDSDMDGDGIDNDQDTDKDGDGVDNDKDSDPEGKEARQTAGISNNCQQAPACSGDPIKCATLKQIWLSACLDRAEVSGGNDCSAAPTCKGDAFKCSLITQTWNQRCVNQSEIDTAIADIAAEIAADSKFDSPWDSEEINDFSNEAGSILNQSGFLGGSCPADRNFSSNLVGSVTISYQFLCDFASTLSGLVLAIAGIVAARNVARAI